MHYSVFFTNSCNMQCKYCYECNKKKQSISEDTINKLIAFIERRYKDCRDEQISIVTHGGEPLLEFEKIKYFIRELNKLVPNIHYIMTTNATLLTEDIIEFLNRNFYMLSISIDGNRKENDRNRIFRDGSGTYSSVVKNLGTLMEKRPDLKARMTVTPECVDNLYDSVLHLASIGFECILPVPDSFSNSWTEKAMKSLYEQGLSLIKHKSLHKMSTDIGFIGDALTRCKNAICDGGISSLTIDTDGTFYPCVVSAGHNEYAIGDIDSGISKACVDFIQEIGKIPNKDCEGCERYNYCASTRCKIINKIKTENYHMPSAITCGLENVKVALALQYRKYFTD